MRVGKKPNVVDAKKTRSCVVRLEKVEKKSPSPVSPLLEDIRAERSNRLTATTMGATPKGRRGGTSQENKISKGPLKKRPVGGSGNLQTSQQEEQEDQLQKTSSVESTMSNVRSNQKIKVVSRDNKSTPASTPSRDETPPPTIAAGRSRRAIKPNPKYASEDMVTPKVVRNVASLSSSNRGGITAHGGDMAKSRKASSSSDDFYNRNSDDDFEDEVNELEDDDEELHNDKVYQANEKDQHDSDFSVVEEQPIRIPRPRGRPRRIQESTATATQQSNSTKFHAQTNVKRTTAAGNSGNLRSAPSQLQQIRRSLTSANTQRNLNFLAGSGVSSGQKRKLEDSQDSSDNESYTISRKQLLLSNSTGVKVKVPVRDNKVNSARSLTTQKLGMQSAHSIQQQSLNGSSNISQTISRRSNELSKSNSELNAKTSVRQSGATGMINQNNKIQSSGAGQQLQNPLATQAKMFASKTRFRSASPKPTAHKEKQNSVSSTTASSSLNNSSKTMDKTKSLSSHNTLSSASAIKSKSTSVTDKTMASKDDSPNSTIDDFETMPTFTIVNVNDIINKKGDVLITKSKSSSSKPPTVIEFSESISLDDEEEDDEEEEDAGTVSPPAPQQKATIRKLPKLPTLNNRKEFENKKSALTRSNESFRKLPTHSKTSSSITSTQAPQILNHKLGLRNSRVNTKATTTLTATLTSPDKPAPRILNSMVAKKTQPVKPMIANMDDSADESFPLSLDEDDDEEEEEETEDEVESRNSTLVMSDKGRREKHHQISMDVDTEDTESQNTEEDDLILQTSALAPKHNTVQQRRRRNAAALNTPIVVSSNKKRMAPAAAKENSLAATNQQVGDTSTTGTTKQSITAMQPRKTSAEKVVISKQGDKIIKKITCFETWYVINMPLEPKRPTVMKNQLEMPLIRLANNAKQIGLPTDMWSSKVTLYELSPQTLAKGTFATYTGDLTEHNINEEDRGKYQPSCVMFRRSIEKNQLSRMPYDRAVIFKNKTFYTNIEGKNVRLVGAPSIINCEREIEILLEVVDALTLQSEFVEHISIVQ